MQSVRPSCLKIMDYNVVFICSDQHRRDGSGCYGSSVRRRDRSSPTPHIDAMAEHGVRFDKAYCNSPLCAPSRASFMTGFHPYNTKVLWHQAPMEANGAKVNQPAGTYRYPGVIEGIPAVAEYFREAGYQTAGIGKMHVHGETLDTWDLGFDVRKLRYYSPGLSGRGMHYSDLVDGDWFVRHQGKGDYLRKPYHSIDREKFADADPEWTPRQNTQLNHCNLPSLLEKEEHFFDYLVAEEVNAFMEEAVEANRPFFAYAGLEKPHPEWSAPQRFHDMYDWESIPVPSTFHHWREQGHFPNLPYNFQSPANGAIPSDEDTVRKSLAGYYASITFMDEQLGRIIQKCKDLGIYERTIFVYTSDHGEAAYDHGMVQKHGMFEHCVAVPLIFSCPALFHENQSTEHLASLVDLVPTFSELTGVSMKQAFDGESLCSVLRGEGGDTEKVVYSEIHQLPPWNLLVSAPNGFIPQRMLRTKTHKYIYTHGVIEQFHDMNQDPDELLNLAYDPSYQESIYQHRLKTLEEWTLDAYPPMQSTVCVKSGEITLSWESMVGATSYRIYRGSTSDALQATLLSEGTALSHVVKDHQPDETFYYWVLAVIPFVKTARQALLENDLDGDAITYDCGDIPAVVEQYSERLPVTRRMQITNNRESELAFGYEPTGFRLDPRSSQIEK